jgi:hypothetical protein
MGMRLRALFRQRSQKMSVASFAGAGLARENDGEGTGFVSFGVRCVGRRSVCESFEGGLDGSEVIEGVETVCAAAKFAGSLRAAKHEEAEDGGLVTTEIEDSADTMLILGDAGVAHRSDEREIFERVKRLANLFFGEIKDRIAAGALVAGINKSVEREGVVFGRRDLFFDKGAEDSELDGVKMHVYKGCHR